MVGGVGSMEILLLYVIQAAVFFAVPIGIFIFARRFLRAYERRSDGSGQLTELTERVRRLEERTEEMASENERLLEGQRFMTKLLAERPPQGE
jgi:membrane protein implicated in regulation of membrane protease activity